MLKKIFRPSTVEKTDVKLKSSLRIESSNSGESEIVTCKEHPIPEKRYFLRRPLRIKEFGNGRLLSYFRTMDPFDIKLSLKRSTSFSFKKPDSSSFGIPRSKSVHFAENLATYHEFKPQFVKEINNLETAFRDLRDNNRTEESSRSESESESDCQSENGKGGEEDDHYVEQEDEEYEGSDPDCFNDVDNILDYESENEDNEKDWKFEDRARRCKRSGRMSGEKPEAEGQKERKDEMEKGSLFETETQKPTNNGGVINPLTQSDCPQDDKPRHELALRIPSYKETSQDKKNSFLQGETRKGMRIAGKQLQSIFSDATENEQFSEAPKHIAFDNSDSTDVDLASEKEKECDYFHKLYEQLCHLRGVKATTSSPCETNQVKSDIMHAITEIGDKLKGCQDQLEQSSGEVRNLKNLLQQTSQELEFQTGIAKDRESDSRALCHAQESLAKAKVENKTLQSRLEAMEESKRIEDMAHLAAVKAGAEQEEQLRKLRTEMNSLQEKLNNSEKLGREDELNKCEKSKLMEQVLRARKETLELQAFQNAEKKVLQEEYKMLQTRSEELEKALNEKLVVIAEKDESLEAQKLSKDKQLEKANQTINDLRRRCEDSRTQVSKIMASLECLRFDQVIEQKDTSLGPPQVRRTLVNEPKFQFLGLEWDSASDIITNIQKGIASLVLIDLENSRTLKKLTKSNKIALESLAALFKGCFQHQVSILDKGCAEKFSSTLSEFLNWEFLDEPKKQIVKQMNTFILDAQRDFQELHRQTEQKFQKERDDRLEFQEQVLDAYSRLSTQILNSNSCTPGLRISGIRGHSSPRKHKSLVRNGTSAQIKYKKIEGEKQ